ncbi:MAG: DUF3344 domain-containing protein [Methanomicrobiaceae archaeon]|nr:DUF3344 domain-containing protein [Methanomicrobiaceae archaeon]
MKHLTLLGIIALILLLVVPGAVSAADVTVSGSVVDEDLTVTAINPNVGAGAAMFANEPNVISVIVTNNGGLEAAASTVSVVIGSETCTAAVGALAAGASETVTVTDTVSHAYATGPITVIATADSDGVIAESDETNNAMTADLILYYNGYKGKRWTDGDDLVTQELFDGRYDVVYSAGTTAYNGAGWTETAYDWSASDLPVPAGATVESARLYQGYTYNKMGVDPAFTMTFNSNIVEPVATYQDIKGFGSYSYPYGLYVYDVTDEFDTAGNTMTITPESGQNYGIYGAYLIVVYQDDDTTIKQIWINDEFDMLWARNSYSVNDDEATAYASFSGVDTTDVGSATAIAILASAGDAGESTFSFNSQEYTGFWEDYQSSPQVGFSVYDVTSVLAGGTNEARLQSSISSTEGDNMYAMNTILVVEKSEAAPDITFTGTPTSGTEPLTVAFAATNTGGLVDSWAWNFGDGETSAEQNPTHEYLSEGTYTVTLTATGPGGSDTGIEENYIQVGGATIEVTLTDASIDFGSMQAGVDEEGSTTVNVDVTGGTDWSVTASANNGGFMGTGSVNLASPFQLSNGGVFQDMTANFADFMTGTAGNNGSGTAHVKQSIDAADVPGSYSITLTFTGSMA